MKKQIAQLVAEHNASSEAAEERYTAISTAITNQLRRHLEITNLFLGFEMRLYDEIQKLNIEIEKLNSKFDAT